MTRHLFSALFLTFLLWGCTTEVYSPKTGLSEAQSHAMAINAVNEHIVDLLTDVFFLDRCIIDYETNTLDNELISVYFPETDISCNQSSICIDRKRGTRLTVATNGTSLGDYDSVWEIEGKVSKLWGDYAEEGFRFTVSNLSGSFLVDGEILTNRLYEKGYFYSDVSLSFSRSSVPIQFTDLSRPETHLERETPVFIIDGSIASFFGDNGVQDSNEPRYDVEVISLKGYDHKEYIGSDPIYDGTSYFQSGNLTCVISKKDKPGSHLTIRIKNETNWELEYNGNTESFKPNTSPIRF